MDEGKIEQYCLLAKGAKGKAVADLLKKATGEPGLFAFGELLDMPHVKELQGTDLSGFYDLLQLFAYGTWADYKVHSSAIGPLDQHQQLKLKQLTVVSLARTSKTIPYAQLMEQLDVQSLRALEDLLITDCFYAGIVKGKLDQKQKCLQVQDATARDVRPEELPAITEGLATWLQSSKAILASVEERVQWSKEASERVDKARLGQEEKIESLRKTMLLKNDEGPGRGEEGDTMLIDDLDHLGYHEGDMLVERAIGGGSGRSKRRR